MTPSSSQPFVPVPVGVGDETSKPFIPVPIDDGDDGDEKSKCVATLVGEGMGHGDF